MVRSLRVDEFYEERMEQPEFYEEERMEQLAQTETPLENAFLWVTSCKPSMAFRLLDSLKKDSSGSSLAGMTEEQAQKIEALQTYIKAEEEKVEKEMKRQQERQERMADQNIVALRQSLAGDSAAVSRVESWVEGTIVGLVDGMDGVRLVDGMEEVMKMGDCVRLKTLKGVLEVLSPTQGVEFLTATCTVQINMRGWDKK